MSDGTCLNKIIEILEKNQGVKIWDSQNPISDETIKQLMVVLQEKKDQAIKEHILDLFGPKPRG